MGPLVPFVHLEAFDGPLDLLLHLCRRQELSITELNIAEVTTQFLAYLDLLDQLEIEVAGEFVEVAALLCLIKSKEMLPVLELAGEEDEDDEADPRAALIERLLDYKKIRDAADALERLDRLHREFFVRGAPPRQAAGLEHLSVPVDAELTELVGALRDLLVERAKASPVHEAPRPHMPLEQRMEQILGMLVVTEVRSFDELLADDSSPAMVVVSLLAILELAKLHYVRLAQKGHLRGIGLQRTFEGAAPSMALVGEA